MFLSAPHLGETLPASLLNTVAPFQNQIFAHFNTISPDLQSINTYRYQRQISPGIQEYMEAISFQHYVETQNLITYREAQNKIPDGVLLTAEDYVLGLFDMTGELMRYAITGIATGSTLPNSKAQTRGSGGKGNILADLRAMRMSFEGMDLQGTG